MTAEKKRYLLSSWLSAQKSDVAIRLFSQGDQLSRKVSDKMKSLVSSFPKSEFLYILLIRTNGESIPLYIGKSKTLLARWESHLNGLITRKGSYSRWHSSLFDSDDKALHETVLLAIPDEYLTQPPIPDFPTTVGSVEYQLVSLVSDVYPNMLLNREGARR